MDQFLTALLSPATLPGTVLLGLCLAYWSFVIVGAVDLDMFDIDLDLDLDLEFDAEQAAPSVADWGALSLKFLNIGDVPLMIWLTAFGLSYWTASMLIDQGVNYDLAWIPILGAIARAFALGVVGAKVMTQPLRGKFKEVETIDAGKLIGRRCEVETSIVDSDFGRIRINEDGAPLMLNARTHGEPIAKGSAATVVDYDPEQRLYWIEPVPLKPNDGPASQGEPENS
ncbi:OB-fold-containig protein [Stratiformator vulcanicus]|uniref:Inner membrane protein YqiJ n=1 Tax=Stratiformator vulcanicus TaxID=2527980 RepID=A0A517R428_9PLAN|nr:OB-fold-containig protein [Stratiformator vulcanicus]QDT38626.1 hypothetical protein Pan189_30210 [Stratiformator vulcanicus]